MSKIKNISTTGWLVAGIIAALLLVPTTAVAVTATTTIIQNGTAADQASVTSHRLQTNDEIKGFVGNNVAGVTNDGQLLTVTTDPGSFVNNGENFVDGENPWTAIISPPSGVAMVVTEIHMNTASVPPAGPGGGFALNIQTGTACTSGSVVGSYAESLTPGSIGETDIPFSPGLAIPAGDALCVTPNGAPDALEADFSVTGYLVPSNEVPAGPLHRAPAMPRQHG